MGAVAGLIWSKPVVPLRWVLIRDPEGLLEPMALLCTDQELSVKDIVTYFVRRWSVEVSFQEVRAHLGGEMQRQWSDLAIARDTPVLLALFSMVTLLAERLHQQKKNTLDYRCLVSQEATLLQRCSGFGKETFVAKMQFIHIPFRSRHGENTWNTTHAMAANYRF